MPSYRLIVLYFLWCRRLKAEREFRFERHHQLGSDSEVLLCASPAGQCSEHEDWRRRRTPPHQPPDTEAPQPTHVRERNPWVRTCADSHSRTNWALLLLPQELLLVGVCVTLNSPVKCFSLRLKRWTSSFSTRKPENPPVWCGLRKANENKNRIKTLLVIENWRQTEWQWAFETVEESMSHELIKQAVFNLKSAILETLNHFGCGGKMPISLKRTWCPNDVRFSSVLISVCFICQSFFISPQLEQISP